MLPSLDNFLCFVEAARCQSFRGAAKAVALTPAAVGQRIRQLEEQLGSPLFQRTTRKIVLTETGLAFLPVAREVLAAAEQAMRVGKGEHAATPVELTIGTRQELGLSWILPMLPFLRKEHPGLGVHLYFGSGNDLLIRVRTLEVDCAVGSMRITDPKIDSVRLHREDYVFVGEPKTLKRTPLRKVLDARAHTLIDVHAELPLFGYWRDSPDGSEPMTFGDIRTMGAISAVRALVLEGEGVAVLPEYLVAPDLKAKRLVRIFPSKTLAHDYFRLIFRADDPRKSLFHAIAKSMLRHPLK